MNYNSKLNKLRSDKNQTVSNIKEIENQKEKELIEAKKLIEEKYTELNKKNISDLEIKKQEIYNLSKLIEKKSTVPGKIFYFIREIISIFEGEDYEVKKLQYHIDKTSPALVHGILMIMPVRILENIEYKNYVRENYINHLIKQGLAIKIIDNWSPMSLPNEFSFYKTDDMGRLIPQISFKGFPYIKDFIDYVINCKIDFNFEEMSEDEMRKLSEDFILLNMDYIQKYYQLKEEKELNETVNKIKSDYKHKQKLLKRFKNRIITNRQKKKRSLSLYDKTR